MTFQSNRDVGFIVFARHDEKVNTAIASILVIFGAAKEAAMRGSSGAEMEVEIIFVLLHSLTHTYARPWNFLLKPVSFYGVEEGLIDRLKKPTSKSTSKT